MKKRKIFCGVGTALITPFKGDEIDYPALDSLIEWQICEGADALIIGGTTGEAATLSEHERYTLYSHCAELISGRVKVIFGTGTNDTRIAVEHTKYAASIGGDAALVVTPYYNKGTEEGIFRHYSLIAEASALPIILYNVPSRTGVNLGLNLLSRLSENENIVGLKEAGDSVDRLVSLAEFCDTLPIYAGNDSQIFPVLSLGGAGVISVVSNILPKVLSDMIEAYNRGNRDRALKIQLELMPFIKVLFTETNPAPIKYAMSLIGKCSGELRLPLAEARDSTKALIERELSRFIQITKN